VAVEQRVEQRRQAVAAPRPAPELGETFFVDVEDDDARIALARHGQPQARVVDDRVHPLDEFDAVQVRRVPGEQQGDRDAEQDPGEVPLHRRACPAREPLRS